MKTAIVAVVGLMLIAACWQESSVKSAPNAGEPDELALSLSEDGLTVAQLADFLDVDALCFTVGGYGSARLRFSVETWREGKRSGRVAGVKSTFQLPMSVNLLLRMDGKNSRMRMCTADGACGIDLEQLGNLDRLTSLAWSHTHRIALTPGDPIPFFAMYLDEEPETVVSPSFAVPPSEAAKDHSAALFWYVEVLADSD